MTEVYEDDATFKELPYYKAIFKSFLKRQIQHLLEELSDETGEESIILTANINNGTLSHLGSNTGKGFLQGRDDIKTQFLAYCLKTNHSEQTQVSTSKSPYLRPASRHNVPSPAEQPVVKRARMTRSSDIPNTASTSSSLLLPNVVPGLSSVPAQPVCLYPALSQPYTVTAADSDYDIEDNTTTTVEEIKTESLDGTSIERNYTHSGASALTYSDSNVLDSHDSKSSLDISRGSADVGNSESGPNLQSEFSANESFDLSSVVIKQELKEGDNELGLSFGDPDKIPNDVSNTGEAESQNPNMDYWIICSNDSNSGNVAGSSGGVAGNSGGVAGNSGGVASYGPNGGVVGWTETAPETKRKKKNALKMKKWRSKQKLNKTRYEELKKLDRERKKQARLKKKSPKLKLSKKTIKTENVKKKTH